MQGEQCAAMIYKVRQLTGAKTAESAEWAGSLPSRVPSPDVRTTTVNRERIQWSSATSESTTVNATPASHALLHRSSH
jgi:hypothetical protein